MKKLISLIGVVGLSTSGTTSVLSINQENNQTVNIKNENYINEMKKQAMNFIENAFMNLGDSVQTTDVSSKLFKIQIAYSDISKSYEILNNVEHTADIVQAKKWLLESADNVDQAARLGNPDKMDYYVGKAVQSLSSSLKIISYDKYGDKSVAQDFIEFSIIHFGRSLQDVSLTWKFKNIELGYPVLDTAMVVLNNAQNTPFVALAKQKLLEGTNYIEQAQKQVTGFQVNYYVGKAVQSLSSSLKNIGFAL
ncbi:hypothetical protein SSYRP_v1c04770 [Spiroplasma syrphidicola EA-1]|uniref:Uncharacterized protein n=1 Tax=Spiroplasma syrphidicola EA-1 TaxID=1276229 RepID=R4UDU6_9MOLU|nr:hypothetical protein [Spiroplasma syrphidicola]AGM26069.1 hypothetical protein SSYRP_v1c04770 [Spiroplasma syrphidicola EA-1]